MNNLPLVSVFIPTYNYAHYIREAIESVVNQTYPLSQIEIIVVDDGSQDNTQTVLQEYINKGIVKYFYQTNHGKAHATYEAVKKCSGKYIFNLDADDYYFSSKIEMSVRIFESDPTIVHVASTATIVNDEATVTGVETFPNDIIDKPIDGNWLLHRFYNSHILFGGGSTYSARASALQQIIIPAGVDMYIDEFLILALFPYGKSFLISKSLSVWRAHTSNYSGANNSKEKAIVKGERLLKSSEAILLYLKEQKFDKSIVKIYDVSNETRKMAFKEMKGTKNITDIFAYAGTVIFQIRPTWNVIKNYHVLNRLLPLPVLSFFKNRKGKA